MKEHLENVRALNILTLFVIVIFLLTRWLPLVWLAIFLLMINTFNNRLARIIAQWWISAMRTLGRINTTIVLSLIFYFVLTPIAFLFRLAHREKTDHFLRNSKESYFEIVDKHFTAPDFERPW
ncbi:MAG: SxtJ family membrane protein [Syntrophales bacterium]|nr:SxtJ family membrane protein [Syntrophales bacterium]